jgi:peptidyl-prolyl cis-trans isomerase D
MLQTIRERFTGPIALAVIGAIGIALVISFGNMDTSGVGGSFAAEVDGEEISIVDFRRVAQNQILRQQEIIQGELPPAMEEQIERNILEGLVRKRVVIQYARDAGYRFGEERLKNYVRNLPVFQVGGEFSYYSYIAVLSSQGMSPESFEREQRSALEIAQLENGIVQSSFYTPEEYRRYIELVAQKREAVFLKFDANALTSKVEIDDEMLQAHYDSNPQQFVTAESVDLEYIELVLEDIRGSVSVDAAAVQEYYDTNQDNYRTLEQRQARHILIATDDDTDEAGALTEARELADRLAGGEDFAGLAAEYSDDSVSGQEGGDLGWASRGDFVPAFEDTLFELQIAETSDPVRTEFGYHLIRLDGVRAGETRPFSEVRDELQEELQMRAAADQFYALAEQIDDLALESSGGLAPVAQDSGLQLKQAKNFTRAGGEPFAYDPSLVDAAFSLTVLEDGENSPLIELGDGHAVVIHVVEHRPSVQRSLEEVRDQLEEFVRLEKAAEEANARGEQVLERARNGEALESLVAEYGVKLVQPEPLSRGSDTADAELVAAIFRAPRPVEGEPLMRGIALGDGGYAVFRLDGVLPGRPEDIPQEQRDERKRVLAQQLGISAAEGLVTARRAVADVYVAPGLFERSEPL